MINLKTSDKIKLQSNILDNNCKAITIRNNIVTDTSEYDSYEEATVAAEMYSLQNVRVEKCNGKYKLISCSEAMDFSKRHLKIGDRVHYGLFHTWEIVDIAMTDDPDILCICLKSGEHKEVVYKSMNKDGQYIFSRLKLGKISAGYMIASVQDFLDGLPETTGPVVAVIAVLVFFLICFVTLIVMLAS